MCAVRSPQRGPDHVRKLMWDAYGQGSCAPTPCIGMVRTVVVVTVVALNHRPKPVGRGIRTSANNCGV